MPVFIFMGVYYFGKQIHRTCNTLRIDILTVRHGSSKLNESVAAKQKQVFAQSCQSPSKDWRVRAFFKGPPDKNGVFPFGFPFKPPTPGYLQGQSIRYVRQVDSKPGSNLAFLGYPTLALTTTYRTYPTHPPQKQRKKKEDVFYRTPKQRSVFKKVFFLLVSLFKPPKTGHQLQKTTQLGSAVDRLQALLAVLPGELPGCGSSALGVVFFLLAFLALMVLPVCFNQKQVGVVVLCQKKTTCRLLFFW